MQAANIEKSATTWESRDLHRERISDESEDALLNVACSVLLNACWENLGAARTRAYRGRVFHDLPRADVTT